MRETIWGKIGGFGIGFVLGGPIGALLGAFAGHFLFDSSSALLAPPSRDVIFTTGLIALAAKMAKADGVVLPVEIEAFEKIIDVKPEEKAKVASFFRVAQASVDGFESYAEQLARAFADEPSLLEGVLDGLFHIAKADRAIHEAELAYLERVAELFGFKESDFARISARHVTIKQDPYTVLGVDRTMSNDELKRHYRQLVIENHPDREIARGMPPEAIRIATERIAGINAVWERIAAEREIR